VRNNAVLKDSAGNVDVDLEMIAPVSLMIQAAYTHIMKARSGTQNNTVSLPQQLSLLLGGEITVPHRRFSFRLPMMTREQRLRLIHTDLRYANQATLGSKACSTESP